jgi:hypothetical protein
MPRGHPRLSASALVSFARHQSARPAVCSLRARLLNEVPGFGAALIARPARVLDRRRRPPRGSPLVCPSRPPVAGQPLHSEPARGEPVDRRNVCCCRADPGGVRVPEKSPMPPRGLPGAGSAQCRSAGRFRGERLEVVHKGASRSAGIEALEAGPLGDRWRRKIPVVTAWCLLPSRAPSRTSRTSVVACPGPDDDPAAPSVSVTLAVRDGPGNDWGFRSSQSRR